MKKFQKFSWFIVWINVQEYFSTFQENTKYFFTWCMSAGQKIGLCSMKIISFVFFAQVMFFGAWWCLTSHKILNDNFLRLSRFWTWAGVTWIVDKGDECNSKAHARGFWIWDVKLNLKKIYKYGTLGVKTGKQFLCR